MTDLIHRLAEIREQAGYDPLPDPRIIEGPPAGPKSYQDEKAPEETQPESDFPDEIVEPMLDPSPLHRIGIEKPPVSPGQFPEPFMAVVEASGSTIASYQGREVNLTEIETAAVHRVVLKALQRQVRAQLAEVEALMPKRKRARRRTLQEAQEAAALSVAPIKRRRGRPRKEKP